MNINQAITDLYPNPVEQAQSAMYAILHLYQKKAGTDRFPLKIKFAVGFPECNNIAGELPGDLDHNSIFLFSDLTNLETKITALFAAQGMPAQRDATNLLLNKVLAPSFKIFARLEEQIEMFNAQAERILTEEQERILEETELDSRKIFFGAAGTGKTFLAMEKAKKLAAQGKIVFLTCFNKNLAHYFNNQIPTGITTANFHDYLLRTLQDQNIEIHVPQDSQEWASFFDETLPTQAFDYFSDIPEDQKFDAIIVDEGQDFKDEWFSTLESMAKTNSEFYVFADPNQSVYHENIENLKRFPISKHRLTQNLRNTEAINNWISSFLPNPSLLRAKLPGGIPVGFYPWQTPAEEKKLIERELGRLVSQGIQPKRIVILSPHIKDKSSLAGMEKLKEWSIGALSDTRSNAVRFSTIRSFKGLEADIVFLIGIKAGSQACTPTDIYVGGSRAKFLLYVFHHHDMATST